MKVRQGFVSNSSSSSFVLLGTKLPKETKQLDIIKRFNSDTWLKDLTKYINYTNYSRKELANKYNGDVEKYIEDDEDMIMDYFYSDFVHNIVDLDVVDDERDIYVGHIIADVSSEESYLESSITDLKTSIDKVEKTFEKLGIEENIKLITGTRPC